MDISNAELEVLNVLWAEAPLPANEVAKRVQLAQDWHEKTVKTLLNRLAGKGAISFEKDGRAYLYSPVIEQANYQQKVSQNFVERLFAGRVSPLVAGFARQGKLSADDVDELKGLIKDWERQQENSDE
ncbi:MAG: BlaI/MecI/CopY family transcriptional regulator [Idiomarina sp.]|nr:BlaI/MecI/CopY family transcriptional regulator [Idiomarina sp.]